MKRNISYVLFIIYIPPIGRAVSTHGIFLPLMTHNCPSRLPQSPLTWMNSIFLQLNNNETNTGLHLHLHRHYKARSSLSSSVTNLGVWFQFDFQRFYTCARPRSTTSATFPELRLTLTQSDAKLLIQPLSPRDWTIATGLQKESW